MLFSSLTFLFAFLPTLILLYFVVRKTKVRNAILLIFSLLFYAWGEPKYIILMLLVIVCSYVFGLLIDYFSKNKNLKLKKLFFILSLVFTIGNLFMFKYYNFVIDNLNAVFNLSINHFSLVLPIGISFYTFQIISYLIDLYKEKIPVQKNLLSLALYVSLFPQLIAGPIVRYETVYEELQNRKETLRDVIYGFKRFIIGLSKKVLISNQMAVIADYIFNNNIVGTSIAWIGAFAYTFQIYFDFSGYSDMAIGLGRIFGFHFLENFNYPYISKSITEFWRRWHISLSSWFRDYVYIPLGGNRVSKIKWLLNICVVWSLTGLWHGASWNFIIWGVYFAIILIFEKIFFHKILEKIPKILQWIYAILLIVIGWVIFRCTSIGAIENFLLNLFTYKQTNWITILSENSKILYYLLYFIPAIICSFPILKTINKKKLKSKYVILISNIILMLLFMLCIIFLTSSTYNPFIYFRF